MSYKPLLNLVKKLSMKRRLDTSAILSRQSYGDLHFRQLKDSDLRDQTFSSLRPVNSNEEKEYILARIEALQ